jgi:ELWxxDGT repeat protein
MRIAVIAFVLALAAPTAASADRLVVPGGPTFTATGLELVAFDGFVYFAANDDVHGNELWRTDGTAAGTTLVKDFYVGDAGKSGNPHNLTVVGTRMFFEVNSADTSAGYKIGAVYTIDPGGTPQETTAGGGIALGPVIGAVDGKALLISYLSGHYGLYALGGSGSAFTEISTGSINVGAEEAATVGGYAYYAQTSGNNSAAELWRTNGTTTEMVKDIRTGVDGSGPHNFYATGNRAYFLADDGFHGRELWVTDGTEGGTVLVHDHNPGTAHTSIDYYAANGNTLYYLPSDPATGYEPWRTDGTEAGTRVVRDITPGTGGFTTSKLFTFGSGFGMLRGSDVYASDGTEAGTTLLGTVDSDGYGLLYPLAVGSRFYFRGGLGPYGSVLWRSDGTPAGTFGLTAGAFDGIAPGNPDVGPPVQLGDKIIFTGRFPHQPGDGVDVSARRIFVLDTTQADETRQATTAPSIAGTPAVGQKLTGARGTWTLEPNTYVYKWLRNGTAIPNATSTEYTPSTADAGSQISFRVTASGIGGPNQVTADSAPVSVGGAVAAPTPTPTPSPSPATLLSLTVRTKAKLTGTARVGKRITLKLPKIVQSGVKLSIRWYANGKLIKKQTKSTLKLASAVKGKRITAKVTVTKTGYRTLTLTAGPTAKVKARRR